MPKPPLFSLGETELGIGREEEKFFFFFPGKSVNSSKSVNAFESYNKQLAILGLLLDFLITNPHPTPTPRPQRERQNTGLSLLILRSSVKRRKGKCLEFQMEMFAT